MLRTEVELSEQDIPPAIKSSFFSSLISFITQINVDLAIIHDFCAETLKLNIQRLLNYFNYVTRIGVNTTAFGRKLTLFQRHPAFPLFT